MSSGVDASDPKLQRALLEALREQQEQNEQLYRQDQQQQQPRPPLPLPLASSDDAVAYSPALTDSSSYYSSASPAVRSSYGVEMRVSDYSPAPSYVRQQQQQHHRSHQLLARSPSPPLRAPVRSKFKPPRPIPRANSEKENEGGGYNMQPTRILTHQQQLRLQHEQQQQHERLQQQHRVVPAASRVSPHISNVTSRVPSLFASPPASASSAAAAAAAAMNGRTVAAAISTTVPQAPKPTHQLVSSQSRWNNAANDEDADQQMNEHEEEIKQQHQQQTSFPDQHHLQQTEKPRSSRNLPMPMFDSDHDQAEAEAEAAYQSMHKTNSTTSSRPFITTASGVPSNVAQISPQQQLHDGSAMSDIAATHPLPHTTLSAPVVERPHDDILELLGVPSDSELQQAKQPLQQQQQQQPSQIVAQAQQLSPPLQQQQSQATAQLQQLSAPLQLQQSQPQSPSQPISYPLHQEVSREELQQQFDVNFTAEPNVHVSEADSGSEYARYCDEFFRDHPKARTPVGGSRPSRHTIPSSPLPLSQTVKQENGVRIVRGPHATQRGRGSAGVRGRGGAARRGRRGSNSSDSDSSQSSAPAAVRVPRIDAHKPRMDDEKQTNIALRFHHESFRHEKELRQRQQEERSNMQHQQLQGQEHQHEAQEVEYPKEQELRQQAARFADDDDDEDQPIIQFRPPAAPTPLFVSQPPIPSVSTPRTQFKAPRPVDSFAFANTAAIPLISTPAQPPFFANSSSDPTQPTPQQSRANFTSMTTRQQPQQGTRVAPSSNLHQSASNARSSSFEPTVSTDIPLRFYPPSYFQQFGENVRIVNSHLACTPESVSVSEYDGTQTISRAMFTTPRSYSVFFSQLVCQSMQGRLNTAARDFARAALPKMNSGGATSSASSNFVRAASRVPPGDLERYMRSRGIAYYDSQSIRITTFDPVKFAKNVAAKNKRQAQFKARKNGGHKRKRGGSYEEADDEEEETPAEEETEVDASGQGASCRYYLTLTKHASREPNSAYRLGDLWILSSDPYFQIGSSSSSNGESYFPRSTRHSFVLFVYSNWHSFSLGEKQKLAIDAVPFHTNNSNTQLLQAFTEKSCYALRLSDWSNDITLMTLLNAHTMRTTKSGTLFQSPLLPYILHGAHWRQFEHCYDSITGEWLSDKERLIQENRRTKQVTLEQALLQRTSSTLASSSTRHSNSFLPLSNPTSHLIAAAPITRSLLNEIHESILQEYTLNDDQREVLARVAGWFWTKTSRSDLATEAASSSSSTEAISDDSTLVLPPRSDPIQLVHGCFGSGKSYLIVILILFLNRVLQKIDPKCNIKIMLASATNVAVDGILIGLQKFGVSYLRVGSTRRVAPQVIPNMLHMTSGKTTEVEALNRARADIKALLDRAKDPSVRRGNTPNTSEDSVPLLPSDRHHLERALNELDGRKRIQHKKLLAQTRVLGTTIAACDFESMSEANLRYSILITDEASQMTEPTAMIPIIRFHCERVLAVGDPNQLGPRQNGADQDSYDPADPNPAWLARPLFTRLREAGIETQQLRQQYRMHPMLSHIPNKLFYDGRLLDGVTPAARFPMLTPAPVAGSNVGAPLSPLVFVNVPNGAEQGSSQGMFGGSLSNDAEVECIITIIRWLLVVGITPSQIGIITPYKAQANKIINAKENVIVQPQCMQPQPFANQAKSKKGTKAAAATTSNGGMSAKQDFSLNIHRPPAVPGPHASQHDLDEASVSAAGIQVSTVDAFQGAEKSLIIFSSVRTRDTRFIDDAHRLNVSWTRAKHHMIVLGNKTSLEKSKYFSEIIKHTFTKPMAFMPHLQAFMAHLQKLQLNPILMQETAPLDANNPLEHHQQQLLSSLRNMAREQVSAAAAAPKSRHHTEAQQEDDEEEDFLEQKQDKKQEEAEEEEPEFGNKEEEDEDEPIRQPKRKKTKRPEIVHESLLSPTERTQRRASKAREKTPTAKVTSVVGATAAASDDMLDDDLAVEADETTSSMSIHQILRVSKEHTRALRQASEAKEPVIESGDDSGEAEMEIEPQPPMTHASSIPTSSATAANVVAASSPSCMEVEKSPAKVKEMEDTGFDLDDLPPTSAPTPTDDRQSRRPEVQVRSRRHALFDEESTDDE